MKKYNLMFGHFGNGFTVCNTLREEHGDYVKLAHIDIHRKVTFYKKIPQIIQDEILYFARTDNSNVSATQDGKIFITAPEPPTEGKKIQLYFEI